MSKIIGLAGKGGVGKTTLAGLLVRYMKEKGLTPILAVDADSNANLNEVLGLEEAPTLGDAREEMKSLAAGANTHMTKDMFIEMKVNQALVEETGYDLLVMGRPEGPGCYCAANNLLTATLDSLMDNYPYIVVDNEAGMEHISRLVTKEVDTLLVVSDASRRSLETAVRIKELTDKLPIRIDRIKLVINQLPNGRVPEASKAVLEKAGVDLLGGLPTDQELVEMDAEGKPTARDLPADNPVVKKAFEMFDSLNIGG